VTSPDLEAKPASLDGSANAVLELAGLLQAGRPEPALTGRAKEPYAHREVADAAHKFAGFARDQYQDAVALLAALSTRLKDSAQDYGQTDAESARRVAEFLNASTYQPPDQRTR